MANVCPLPQGQSLTWKPLGPPAERTWHSLSWRCSPGHGSGAGINPRRSPKGSQTPQPFSQGLFLPSGLGVLFFFLLKAQFLSMRQQHWATRQDTNLSREVGTTLQDCCLPRRTFWLNSWRTVSYLTEALPPESLGGLGTRVSNLEALSRVRTQSRRETAAVQLSVGGWNKEVSPAGGPGGTNQPALEQLPVRAGGRGCW